MTIIITIPAYNEEKDIARVITEIREVMNEYNYKILVMDDGSKDKTVAVSKKHADYVFSNEKNKGLAETFKVEMKHCINLKADIIVHTDADGQYPAKYIPSLINKIGEGYDLVLGSRFEKGSYSGSFMKKLGNIAFAKVFSSLLKTRITDTTTGFRAFTKEIAELPLINNFTYTQEQLIRAGKAKMRIGEIPITTKKTRDSRLFKNSFSYALKAWINILRIYRDYNPLRFFGKIGLSLFIAGFILGLWVIHSILTTGGVGGIPRVILSAVLILAGIQVILFGFLADMLGERK